MTLEKYQWKKLKGPVIGVDEVGRGCLAGSVYAAAVYIDPAEVYLPYTDSKKLSEKKRKELTDYILEHHRVGIGFASVDEIYELNILKASLLAMQRAVLSLQMPKSTILVDGKFTIPGLMGYEQIPLIKGDFRAEPIAAASIVAKVTRDEELKDLAQVYPHYGFEKHKGYGTQIHKKAIQDFGPCPIHRKSFAGVKEFL